MARVKKHARLKIIIPPQKTKLETFLFTKKQWQLRTWYLNDSPLSASNCSSPRFTAIFTGPEDTLFTALVKQETLQNIQWQAVYSTNKHQDKYPLTYYYPDTCVQLFYPLCNLRRCRLGNEKRTYDTRTLQQQMDGICREGCHHCQKDPATNNAHINDTHHNISHLYMLQYCAFHCGLFTQLQRRHTFSGCHVHRLCWKMRIPVDPLYTGLLLQLPHQPLCPRPQSGHTLQMDGFNRDIYNAALRLARWVKILSKH